MKKTIVSMMAHADDLEETAGGTFAKYIDHGYRGLLGVLSLCNSGWNALEDEPVYTSSLKIMPKRRQEAAAAAEVFGAELFFGTVLENNFTLSTGERVVPGYDHLKRAHTIERFETEDDRLKQELPDGDIFSIVAGFGDLDPVHPLILEVEELLVEWEPEIVLAQEIGNFNPDHFDAAQIVAMAWIRASRRVELGSLYLPVVPLNIRPVHFPQLRPDFWVDVTGYEETARAALACHICQGGGSAETQSLLDKRWSYFGNTMGVQSGEAFCRCLPIRDE